MKDKCPADNNGKCMAAVCYTDEKCNSRDEEGYPKYCSNEELKELFKGGK